MSESPIYPECESIVTSYGNDFRYCGFTVGEMGAVNLSPLAPLSDGELFAPGDLLYLDTETTGLSGGPGTVAFLLGVGHFCKDGFIIKQYLMRDYDEEPSQLQHLTAEMGGRCALVTYNGKAFDMNLLESRFIMNGMRLPKAGCHIDLLRPSRRIWRRCIENCRLTTIENEILGERRVDDVPGSLIPKLYFDYLETKEDELLEGVLIHNRNDILAMAAILKYITDLIDRTSRGESYETMAYKVADRISKGKLADRTSEELLGLAGYLYSLKNLELAETCLQTSMKRDKPAVTRRALRMLAEMKKREGKHAEAAVYWMNMLKFAPASGIYPFIELAKYYEHKERNPEAALIYTDLALRMASMPVYASTGARGEIEARRDRLIRKQARVDAKKLKGK